MVKQYLKQALYMLKENRFVSVISIAGTAISIAIDHGSGPGVPGTVCQLLSGEQS